MEDEKRDFLKRGESDEWEGNKKMSTQAEPTREARPRASPISHNNSFIEKCLRAANPCIFFFGKGTKY
jgi:hypothetical protein